MNSELKVVISLSSRIRKRPESVETTNELSGVKAKFSILSSKHIGALKMCVRLENQHFEYI